MCTITDTSATMTDEERMQAYVQGDERAFVAMFRGYESLLLGFFLRKGKRYQDARDLVQETFLHVHRSRAKYRSGAPLRPWLFTIARNLSHDHHRRQQRRSETPCDDVDSYQAQPAAEMPVQHERTRALASALDQLPHSSRELLHDYWLEERSWLEIARRDGVHAGTLRVRAHRACVQLRRLIDDAHSSAA